MKTIAKVILKGLVVVIPIVGTLYVIWWLGSSAEQLLGPVLKWVLPDSGLLKYWPGMGVLLGLAATFAIGLLTYATAFRAVVGLLGRLMEKVPLVKSLYGALRDLVGMMPGGKAARQGNQVVAVELSPGIRLLGLITQSQAQEIPEPLCGQDDRVAVYLPMSYQIGGFTVFMERGKLRPVDMNVEDAMRFALTAGMSSQERDADKLLGSPRDRQDRRTQQDGRD